MRKIIYSLFAASMMLAASSCSQDEDIRSATSDDGVVTFKVSLEGATHSRTAGDGSTVSKLYYEVYQNDTKVLDNHGDDANAEAVAIVKGEPTVVEMPIMRGEKYDILFWAEAENSVYDATKLKEIKIDYTKTVANNENLDAFFCGLDDFQATSNETTIVLTRPFGQLNIGTSYNEDEQNLGDWQVAKDMIDSGDPVTASQIKVKGLANRFNVLTHVAYVAPDTEVGEVTFTKAKLIGETFEVKISETEKPEYMSLAMNYLLIPTNVNPEGEDKHSGNVDIVAASFWRNGEDPLFDLVIPNVPVTRNWRTNILGDLLADDKTFEIVISPDFDDDYNYPNTMEEKLRMAAATGGTVTLTEDVALSQTLNVQSDMTINLNGKNITVANESNELGEGDGIIVTGGKLTINGEGTVKANTRAVWARGNGGAEIVINGGTYVGATTADANSEVIYASGNGKISIYGGTFEAVNQSNGFASPQYAVLNLQGNGKTGCDIEVYGGKFKNFNPADNISENPKQSFVAEGYEVVTKTEGTDTWYNVIGEVTDIIMHDDYAEVYTAEGLLEFVNFVNTAANHSQNGFNLQLMQDIEMPAYTIEKDADGKYVFTDTPITFDENGVPSGSNWIPICGDITINGDKITDLTEGFNGCIDGNGMTISNLYVIKETPFTGFVGFMYEEGMIKNLTIANSVIKGTSNTGVVGGRSQHGSRIENVHVFNSKIMGTGNVGGIVGYNYRRKGGKNDYEELLAYVKDCTTDKDTKIEATDSNVGGICGNNYGAVIVNCVNNADVKGTSCVGGIVGYCRDYWADKTNPVGIVADAYVIACTSTADAQLEATDGSVGGIMGFGLADNSSHVYTCNFAVACSSLSHVTGKRCGSIVGEISHETNIIGCWADEKEGVQMVGSGDANAKIKASAQYQTSGDLTEEKVIEMNTAINEFNSTNAEQIKCEYKWVWVNGEWPKLVPSANND